MTNTTRRLVQRTVLLAAVGATSLLGFLATPAEAAPRPADHHGVVVPAPHVKRPGMPVQVPAEEWPW